MNAALVLGRRWGALVMILDAGKGAIACLLAAWLADSWSGAPAVAGLAAIAGHVWPVWSGFRGGKGVATLFGASVVLVPVAAAAFAVVGASVSACRRSSTAAITSAALACSATALAGLASGSGRLWSIGDHGAAGLFAVVGPVLVLTRFRPARADAGGAARGPG